MNSFFKFLLAALLAGVAVSAPCEDVYPKELDVGIYWAARPRDKHRFYKSCIDSLAFPPNAYDPTKPTLIVIHGAQPNIVVDDAPRMGVQDGFDTLTNAWIAARWNVGFFQWPQLADEPLSNFERAEAKIWNTRYYENMKYTAKDDNGNLLYREGPIKYTVAEQLVMHLAPLAAIAGKRPELRFMGHSLGTQLAIRAAHLMQAAYPDMLGLTRIAMLDPVFSPFPPGYLTDNDCGNTILAVIGCYIRSLTGDSGVAVEVYRSSMINRCIGSAEYNPEMMYDSAYEHVKFNAWGEQKDGYCFNDHLWSDPKHLPEGLTKLQNQIYNQHTTIVPYYMMSLVYPPKKCILVDPKDKFSKCNPTADIALSAAMPTPQVFSWHNATDDDNEKLCFHQWDDGDRSHSGSTITVNPGDDMFYESSCDHFSV